MTIELPRTDDPAAGTAQVRQWLREAYRSGYENGRRGGIEDTIAWYKRLLTNTVADARLEQRRWHVCCGLCRRGGHRNGCTRCEDRSRGTYGEPHSDDYPGQDGPR